jgi:hypothetical protein
LLKATQMGENVNFIVILIYNNRKGFGLWSNAMQGEIFLENRTRAKRRFWKISSQTKYQVMNDSLIYNLSEREYGLESHTFALNYRKYQFVPLCYWTSKVWKIYLDENNVSDSGKNMWKRGSGSDLPAVLLVALTDKVAVSARGITAFATFVLKIISSHFMN